MDELCDLVVPVELLPGRTLRLECTCSATWPNPVNNCTRGAIDVDEPCVLSVPLEL